MLLLGELLDLAVSLDELSLQIGNSLGKSLVLSLKFLLAELLGGLNLLGVEFDGLLLLHKAGGEGSNLNALILSTQPLISGHRGLSGSSVGVDVILEDIRLSGDLEGDGLQELHSELVESDDLACGDIDSSLGHHSQTSLRSRGLELRQRVQLIISQLEISNVSVSLSSHEDDVEVGIKEGHQDSRGRIDVGSIHGLGHVSRVPEAILSLRLLGESNGQELVLQPDNSRGLDSHVSLGFGSDGLVSGVDDSDLSILGTGGQKASVCVPFRRRDEIGMLTIDRQDILSLLDIPDLHREVTSRSDQRVVGSGREFDGSDLSSMSIQSLEGLRHVGGQTTLGDSPDLSSAIFGNRGNEVI